MAQGFLLFFLCGPLSHIHLRINISQRVKVITSTNTWHHRSAKEHIPLKFQLYSSFKTQRRNDCTKSGSRVLTFPYLFSKQTLLSHLNCLFDPLSIVHERCARSKTKQNLYIPKFSTSRCQNFFKYQESNIRNFVNTDLKHQTFRKCKINYNNLLLESYH